MSNKPKIRAAGRFSRTAHVRREWNQASGGRGPSGRIESVDQPVARREGPPPAAGKAGKVNTMVFALRKSSR